MIVLWVVLEHLGFFLVVEMLDKIISPEFFSPFLAIDEPASPLASHRVILRDMRARHLFRKLNIEFPGA